MEYSKAYIYHRILGCLEDAMGMGAVDAYFGTVELIDSPGEALELRCGPMRRKLLINECLPRMQEALSMLELPEMEIRFVTPEEAEASAVPKNPSPDKALDYRFDNFLVGDSNRLAVSAAKAVAEQPGTAFNPLVICGEGSGVGKTHLLYAIYNEILSRYPEKKVIRCTTEYFMGELVNAIANNRTEQFREKYRKIDALLVDDVQYLVGKESSQMEFMRVLNGLLEDGKQVVITSGCPLDKLYSLNNRLASRLSWGLTVQLGEMDEELRYAYAARKAEEIGLNLSPERLHDLTCSAGDARVLTGKLLIQKLRQDS